MDGIGRVESGTETESEAGSQRVRSGDVQGNKCHLFYRNAQKMYVDGFLRIYDLYESRVSASMQAVLQA